jgi:Raf kinase inhibitor-like YbhB/YbcL family protein
VQLTSRSFAAGESLPTRCTCDGDDVSPPLGWSDIPPEARSLALVLEEPEASFRPVTHWLGWQIDPRRSGLGEGEQAPVEGRNDFGAPGYRGPCPPAGGRPRGYLFRLLALDADVELAAGAGRRAFEQAIDGHVVATAELPVLQRR